MIANMVRLRVMILNAFHPIIFIKQTLIKNGNAILHSLPIYRADVHTLNSEHAIHFVISEWRQH